MCMILIALGWAGIIAPRLTAHEKRVMLAATIKILHSDNDAANDVRAMLGMWLTFDLTITWR